MKYMHTNPEFYCNFTTIFNQFTGKMSYGI